ncbi:MAG: DUF2239 family protein, partial [Gemmatimonadaceae bacterium]
MDQNNVERRYVAFAGESLVAEGELAEIAIVARKLMDSDPGASLLIFDDVTSEQVDVDVRGSDEEIVYRYRVAPSNNSTAKSNVEGEAAAVPRGPGRPKLGVVAREVTLLPRHWAWLSAQPGGASVALRRLVEEARRGVGQRDRLRQAQESAYRFVSAMAGNQVGFEEATRALFAGDRDRFDENSATW